MNLQDQARDLLQNLDSRLNASAYDVAWMARVRSEGGMGLLWPEMTDWLLDHQWSDGSWGGAIPTYHDRVLCTLAAIIAIAENNSRSEHDHVVQSGERFLWNHLHFLHHDPKELVGFELLMPSLMESAQALGLDVPQHFYGYGRIRDAKLSLLPLDTLYSPKIGASIAFSLEFLGSKGDPRVMQQLQGPNGSIANSPAATAYFIQKVGPEPRAIQYLQNMRIRREGVPGFYPYRTFELAWVLEHLSFGEIQLDEIVSTDIWRELQSAITLDGISMDPNFAIKDGDTTSVTLRALALGGQPVDPMVLHYFENPKTRVFRTMDYERNASMTTNAHALEALALMPDYPEREIVIESIIQSLLENRIYETYWTDKWHISPFYATSHILIALMKIGEHLIVDQTQAVQWFLHTQRPDGSWGYFQHGTVEETAYALLTLLHYHWYIEQVDSDIIKRGMAYIQESLDGHYSHPEFWIAKSLYAPQGIIEAALLAVQSLFEKTFGSISV